MARVPRKKVTLVSAPEEAYPEEVPRRQKKSSPSAVSVMGVLLCISLGVAGYFFYQYKHTAEVAQREEIEKLVSVIGGSMELPQGEFPTLATVTNKEKLDSQPFFKRAENGDKILIYSGSGRAVLYRPSTKKIIDVTTVSITDENVPAPKVAEVAPAPAPAAEAAAPETAAPAVENVPTLTETQVVSDATLAPQAPTVALYNGSTKVGVTNTVETTVKEAFPDVVVEKKEKAAKNDYVGTLVIDLSEKRSDLATQMAAKLGGTVATLPVGETNPGTDLLVIVANK